MATRIRRLSISDYDDIVRLWQIAGLPYKPHGRDSRQSVANEMALPQVRYFGMYNGDDMLGVIIANYDGRRGWLNRMAVDPDHRGKGLAGKLIKVAEDFLEQQGAVVICGLIEEMNTPSMACFAKSGYTCMEEIKYFSKRQSKDS
jgi:GNAT superfamily N-acetyltransferase